MWAPVTGFILPGVILVTDFSVIAYHSNGRELYPKHQQILRIRKNKNVVVCTMSISHRKTGIKLTPETSFISNTIQMIDNAQLNRTNNVSTKKL